MDLTALGFDGWFEQQSATLLQPGHRMARVTAVDRDAFLVRDQDAESYAELAGKFRFDVGAVSDLPCVGDWVCVQGHASGGPAVIHGVVPRKTFLRRKCPGKTVDFQMIAANLDAAFIVQAWTSSATSCGREAPTVCWVPPESGRPPWSTGCWGARRLTPGPSAGRGRASIPRPAASCSFLTKARC